MVAEDRRSSLPPWVYSHTELIALRKVFCFFAIKTILSETFGLSVVYRASL